MTDNDLEIAATLRKIKELLGKAKELAEPILRRWKEEEESLTKKAA
jgi:hypothetical protein